MKGTKLASIVTRPRGRATLAGVAALAAVALAVTGCTAAMPTETTPVSEPASTQAPVETTAPAEATGATEPFPLAEADPSIPTDFIPEGFVAYETVTDDLGTYARITFAPDNPILQWENANPNLELIEEHGFTVEEAQEAHQAAAAYFQQEFLDSKHMDTDSLTIEDWIAENGQFWAPSVVEKIAGAETLLETGVATSTYIPLGLERDRPAPAPRMWPTVRIDAVEAYERESEPGRHFLNVGFSYTNTFSVPQAVAEAAYARGNGSDGSDLVSQNPAMVDEAGMVGLIYTGNLWLNYDPDTNQFVGARGTVFMYESNGGTEFFTL